MSHDSFTFQRFQVRQELCGMKVGTDGVLLGAWAHGGSRILDIGTGTGLVALMMAQRYPLSHVTAIDIDPDACCQATANVVASPFADRIEVVCCPLQDFLPGCMYDCVVANPPYYDNTLTCPDARRSTARHTDTLPFPELMAGAARLLTPDGSFSVVVPTDVQKRVHAACAPAGLWVTKQCMVRTVARKPPRRALLEFAKHEPSCMSTAEEVLTGADGERSEWYSRLTRDFYLP